MLDHQARVPTRHAKGTENVRLGMAKPDGRNEHGHVHDKIELNGEVTQHEIGARHGGLKRECEAKERGDAGQQGGKYGSEPIFGHLGKIAQAGNGGHIDHGQ